MRKEGKGRKYRQQFINVPLTLIKEDALGIPRIVPNKSKFAGKRKRIVHQLAPKY